VPFRPGPQRVVPSRSSLQPAHSSSTRPKPSRESRKSRPCFRATLEPAQSGAGGGAPPPPPPPFEPVSPCIPYGGLAANDSCYSFATQFSLRFASPLPGFPRAFPVSLALDSSAFELVPMLFTGRLLILRLTRTTSRTVSQPSEIRAPRIVHRTRRINSRMLGSLLPLREPITRLTRDFSGKQKL